MLYQIGYFKKAEVNGKTIHFGRIHIAGLEPINFTATFKNGIYNFYYSLKNKDGNEVAKVKFATLWAKQTKNKNYKASGRAFIGGQDLKILLIFTENMNEENPYDYGIFISIPDKKYQKQVQEQQQEVTNELPDEDEDIPF